MEIASPFDNFVHIIEADENKPSEQQRKLTARFPTMRENAVLQDMKSQYSGDGGVLLNTGSTNLMAVHMCLLKMENFFDKNKNPIVLERDNKQMAALPGGVKPWNEIALQYIPEIDFIRCASKIKAGGTLEDEEVKN